MSVSLRPVLRPSSLPSLPSSSKSTTYICQSCRHARLLRRPKRPYTFSQLVTLSDGSAFMIRTTSPQPVYRSTRDTRNALLWNPSSKELMNVEDDEAGRLAGFRARFGTMFDAVREKTTATTEDEQDQLQSASDQRSASIEDAAGSQKTAKDAGPLSPSSSSFQTTAQSDKDTKKASSISPKQQQKSQDDYDELQYEFEEDDANLLDLISSYGQQGSDQNKLPAAAPTPTPASNKNKKGKK